MLSGPFLSRFVLLLPEHRPRFTHRPPRCTQSTQRGYHLSVVYGGNRNGSQDDEDRGSSSLAFASEKGHPETVKYLVTKREAFDFVLEKPETGKVA